MAEAPFYLTDECLAAYYQFKLDSGVSPVSIGKYKDATNCLIRWLGEDRELTVLRLQEWRQFLETSGFGKHTVQRYVANVNTCVRTMGHTELCIPRPMRTDLTGMTYGYLTVLEPTDRRSRKDVLWRCRCKCGKEVEVTAVLLKGGNTTSCGCRRADILQHHNRYQEGTELRQSMEEKVRNPNSASGYVGVQPRGDKWNAYINYKGVHYNLGSYSKMEDAVKVRARAKEAVMEDAARIYEETDHLYGEPPLRPPKPPKEPPAIPEPVIIPARRSNNTSGCPGVYLKKGKWCVNITVNKYRYRLGAYDDLEDAIAARKNAEALVLADDLDTLKAVCTNWK